MTPIDPTQPDTIESAEPASGGRLRRRNLVVGLAAVAALAAAATGVAMASTSTPTPSPSGSSSAPGAGPLTQEGVPGPAGREHGMRGGPGGFGGPGGIGGMGEAMGALHGVFTVPKQGGGVVTLVVQRGTVTAVSATSIAVKSTDGFAATYAVPAAALVNAARDGLGSVKKGDEVSVLAQQKSGDDTALQIGDLTRWQGLRDEFGPPRGTAPKAPTTPTPGSTGTTGSSAFGI